MESGLNSIKNLFESIVSLFGALFGFLPTWVQGFVGTGVAFMIGVFIYKLIRG